MPVRVVLVFTSLCLMIVACGAPKVGLSDGGNCGAEPLLHRASTVCSDPRPASADQCPSGQTCNNCRMDSDCVGGLNGRCVYGRAGLYCSYDLCTQDTDCTGGEICGCRLDSWQGANACVQGNCAVDSDCGSCGFCSPSTEGCGISFFCHTVKDECLNDSDCPHQGGLPPQCQMDATAGHWKCALTTCSG